MGNDEGSDLEEDLLRSVQFPSRHRFGDNVDVNSAIQDVLEQKSEEEIVSGLVDYLSRELNKTYGSRYNPREESFEKAAKRLMKADPTEEVGFLEMPKIARKKAAESGFIDHKNPRRTDMPTEKYIKGLKDYLKSERSSEVLQYYQEEVQKEKLVQKARDIVEGTEKAQDILPDLDKEEARKKQISNAISKGYITGFKIKEPWHPYPFLTGQLETFPFQHEETYMYHGTFKSIFYRRGEKPSEAKEVDSERRLCNPASIITQGAYWKRNVTGGATYNLDDRVFQDSKGELNKGIFLWPVPGTVGDIVLELRLPTENLIHTSEESDISTTREMFEYYGSPREWRKHFVSDEKGKSPSYVEFVYMDEIDIDRIRAVGVNRNSKESTSISFSGFSQNLDFIPLDEYVERLEKEGADIPRKGEIDDLRRRAEYEYRRMQEIHDLLITEQEGPYVLSRRIFELVCYILVLKKGEKLAIDDEVFDQKLKNNIKSFQDSALERDEKDRLSQVVSYHEEVKEKIKKYNELVDRIFHFLEEEPNWIHIDNLEKCKKWYLRNQNNQVRGEVKLLLEKQHDVLQENKLEDQKKLLDLEAKVGQEAKKYLPKIHFTDRFDSALGKNSTSEMF